MVEYVGVIVGVGGVGVLRYKVPEGMVGVGVGVWVRVPLGAGRLVEGLVVSEGGAEEKGVVVGEEKEVREVISEGVVVREEQMRMWRWVGEYYLCELGEVYRLALGWLEVTRGVHIGVEGDVVRRGVDKEEGVCFMRGDGGREGMEVCIGMVKEEVERGGQVLFMVPEEEAAEHWGRELGVRMGGGVKVWHSGRSKKSRREVWQRMLEGEGVEVVVGTGGAVFLPWGRVGLVVVWDEGSSEYKHVGRAPRYHGRSCGIMLGRLWGAKVVLVGAEPSLDSYYQVLRGKYGYEEKVVEGGRRVGYKIVDVRAERKSRKMRHAVFAPELIKRMGAVLAGGGQVVLVERQGSVEEVGGMLVELYGGVKVGVMGRVSRRRVMRDFNGGEVDILVYGVGSWGELEGIAWSRVGVVGVLCMDWMMGQVDFRAVERSYGRMRGLGRLVSRSEVGGEVVVQSREAGHWVMEKLVKGDWAGFAEVELGERKEFVYPPYCRVITVVVRGRREAVVKEFGESYAGGLRGQKGVEVVGPGEVLRKVAERRYEVKVLVKVGLGEGWKEVRAELEGVRRGLLGEKGRWKGVEVYYDVDL
jgi:primosomal protein N'